MIAIEYYYFTTPIKLMDLGHGFTGANIKQNKTKKEPNYMCLLIKEHNTTCSVAKGLSLSLTGPPHGLPSCR